MKKRLDQIVLDSGFAESKNKAQALIMAGQVFVDGNISDKVGTKYEEDTDVSVKALFPYVSRGALKLEKAFKEFNLNFDGKVVCDIGSSTGGFSDFALQNGASKIFAVDVGTGQLAQKIREDARVVVMEKTDFRNVDSLPDNIDIFVCDVSFISLKKIIPKVAELISISSVIPAEAGIQKTETGLRTGSQIKSGMTIGRVDIILLIKPQFEAGAREVSKGKGVIRDASLQKSIVADIKSFSEELGFTVAGITTSPITGAKGNVEFLLFLKY